MSARPPSTHPSVLDEAMPAWFLRERHRLPVMASSDRVMAATRCLTWREVPGFQRLIRLRRIAPPNLSPDTPVISLFTDGPFRLLHQGATELLFGAYLPTPGTQSGSPARPPHSVPDFASTTHPGTVKVALNFTFHDGMLQTETRALPAGRLAKVRFALYWALIRAGSGFIRSAWLRGIRRRAQATPCP